MYKKKNLVLSLDKVSLSIPVFSKTELSLKKTFYRAVTGTKISIVFIRSYRKINTKD